MSSSRPGSTGPRAASCPACAEAVRAMGPPPEPHRICAQLPCETGMAPLARYTLALMPPVAAAVRAAAPVLCYSLRARARGHLATEAHIAPAPCRGPQRRGLPCRLLIGLQRPRLFDASDVARGRRHGHVCVLPGAYSAHSHQPPTRQSSSAGHAPLAVAARKQQSRMPLLANAPACSGAAATWASQCRTSPRASAAERTGSGASGSRQGDGITFA